MCRFWPHDWFTITPGDQEETFSGGRRSIITGPHFLIFHPVAISLQGMYEPLECFPYAAPIGMTVLAQRPPILELFYVFQHDYARFNRLGPFHCNPRKTTDVFAFWFPTLGLGKVLAVRGEPSKRNGMP